MLHCQKHKFSLPDDISYFNVAYMSPLLKVAELQGLEALMKKSNPTLVGINDFFDPVAQLKSSFSQLIHADKRQIALIPSVSYGMANAAKNLKYKPKGEIICLSDQFPSNYYPWQEAAVDNNQQLKIIYPGEERTSRVKEWNDKIVSAINTNTTAVCMGHVHWADGSLYDLKRISAACQANETYLILDGTQSVGALPIDIEDSVIPICALSISLFINIPLLIE